MIAYRALSFVDSLFSKFIEWDGTHEMRNESRSRWAKA
jgi:hypothetical protein